MKSQLRTFSISVVSAILALASGCATTTLESKTYKSYAVGVTTAATIGDPFLVDQNGSIEKVKTWVGVMNSPNGWKVEDRYSQDYIRKELIYAGKSGNTIEISYREFRGGLAAPAFFQNLKYDISQSKLVRFQKFQIEIQSADNQSITYRILSD